MLSVTGPGPLSAELAGVLRSWRSSLIADWEASVAARMESGQLDRDQLGEHLPALLDAIERCLLTAEPMSSFDDAPGMARMVEEVKAPEALPELRQLRGVLLQRWWMERALVGGAPELLALDAAFDAVQNGLAHLDVRRQRREFARQAHVLDAVIMAAPDGIAILNGADLRIRLANPRMRELLRKLPLQTAPNGPAAGDVGRAMSDPDWVGRLRRVADERVAMVNREVQLELPGGPEAWSLSAVALPGEDGRAADVLLVVTDVSQQAAQRRQLAEERRRMEEILHALPAGVILAGADGGIVYANEAARTVWGGHAPAARSIEEYVQYRGWWVRDGTRVQPGDWPLARAVRHGECTTGVLIDIERFDGTCGTMMNNAAPLRDADGRLAGAVTVMLDMTEQRRLAVTLEQQTAQMNAVLDSIVDGLLVFDAQGELTRANASALAMLPYDEEELRRAKAAGRLDRVTSPGGGAIPPERLPSQRALHGETVRGEMMCFTGPDGSVRWVCASAAPFRSGAGALLGAVVILSDVTHLQEMRRQMEDLLRMLSHDLRTPLGTVLLQSQLLERRPVETPETVVRRAHAIATSAGRMNAMIQDLVELARLETGRMKLDLGPVDARAFVLDLKERLAGTFPTQRVRVLVPEHLPPLCADPARLERILTNLLSNALKYSQPETEVQIRAEDRDGGVALSVIDSGPGIPAEDLPHVFERYYRTRRAERGEVEGIGLGLYITRQLVEAQGASLTVNSEVGRGSTFTIVFPKA